MLFAIPRVVGWLAHWREFLTDPHRVIVRPRQNYVGHRNRKYVTMSERKSLINDDETRISNNPSYIRRHTGNIN